ncbi:hypothetical protein LO763_22075 [Glycomyces sp. A-F 0318]|uniref:hypothetical protein n=1 Tax=Glycomyces amatae TaxID=2881355 RepID=UPI001E315A5C|nr:hypothetical protein [Glycomyces amatae]MCD0446305.1 hypothetical protein [Glycomyces amatae]
MQPQDAIWRGILLALESAGITLIALVLAALIWFSRFIFDDLVLVPLLKRQPPHGLIRGFLDWAEKRWRLWRTGAVGDAMALRRRVGGACFAVVVWCFSLLMLYRLTAERTAAVVPETEYAAYLPILVGLVIVVVAGPLELKRGLRTLPYPLSERHPTTSYLAAEPGFKLPLLERYTMASLINLLRLSRILVIAFLVLCLPEASSLANLADFVDNDAYAVAAAVYVSVALVLAYATIKLLHTMLLRVVIFEQIDVLLAAHHPEALPNPPKRPVKKPQIGPPLKRIQRGIDRLAYRLAHGYGWIASVLEAVADRIDVYRHSRPGSNDRQLDANAIDLLERAGAILASHHDTKAIMAFATPIGVVDPHESVVRVDRVPTRPTRFARAVASIEHGWKRVALLMAIAATAWALVAAVTGDGTWADFMNRWTL